MRERILGIINPNRVTQFLNKYLEAFSIGFFDRPHVFSLASEDVSNSTRQQNETLNRRTFWARLSSYFMAIGLVAGYGTFVAFMGRFLFPGRQKKSAWQFVAQLGRVSSGQSLSYTSPAGQQIVISRTGNRGSAEDFIALSSVCPHLGCQVHWEGQNNRFFCPCHSGAFDPEGNPIAGPVKEANQSLARYPLKVENGLLYIQADLESLV